MIPSTVLSLGFAKQKNIGLDKENFTGAMSYNWTLNKNTILKYDLFNILYVKNINVRNYFNVYSSSYQSLNALSHKYGVNPSYVDSSGNLIIESGTNSFINDWKYSNILIQSCFYSYVFAWRCKFKCIRK